MSQTPKIVTETMGFSRMQCGFAIETQRICKKSRERFLVDGGAPGAGLKHTPEPLQPDAVWGMFDNG